MKKVLSALALAICAVGSTQAAPVQWTMGSGGNDHWYEYFDAPSTWTEARALALAAGGYLATLTSEAENMFASALAIDALGVLQLAWIGGTDEATEGTWKWADGPEAGITFWTGDAGGTASGYTSWAGFEPNDFVDGEDYAHTNWGGLGIWNDHGAPNSPDFRHGYLVEYDLGVDPRSGVPEPLTLAMVASGLLAAAVTRRRRA